MRGGRKTFHLRHILNVYIWAWTSSFFFSTLKGHLNLMFLPNSASPLSISRFWILWPHPLFLTSDVIIVETATSSNYYVKAKWRVLPAVPLRIADGYLSGLTTNLPTEINWITDVILLKSQDSPSPIVTLPTLFITLNSYFNKPGKGKVHQLTASHKSSSGHSLRWHDISEISTRKAEHSVTSSHLFTKWVEAEWIIRFDSTWDSAVHSF